MIKLQNRNYELDVSRGIVVGVSAVNKFGESPDGIQTSATDIWPRADSTPTQQIWLAPTAARVHNISSTSTDDDGAPLGSGARTIRVWYLPDWDTAEATVDLTMNGTTNVEAPSCVHINRMKVLTYGTSLNTGTITATAVTDGTVTAVILPGFGQTEQAILGVPSTQNFYLTRLSCTMSKTVGASTVGVRFQIRVNESPDVNTLGFISKDDMDLLSIGLSADNRKYDPPIKYGGPCIIKIQATATAADTDGTAGFGGYLVTE